MRFQAEAMNEPRSPGASECHTPVAGPLSLHKNENKLYKYHESGLSCCDSAEITTYELRQCNDARLTVQMIDRDNNHNLQGDGMR
jgi:hypothetical protein